MQLEFNKQMGAQSVLKPIYDAYAQRYFVRNRWRSWVVAKKGRYCDVIAARGADIAVVEVKSPAEGSVDSSYDDTRGLSAALRASLPTGYDQRRRTICTAIPRQTAISVVKLYAVSIACQLLRYVREYDERSGHYATAAGMSLGTSSSHMLAPYIVVPVELQQQATMALSFLQQRGCISSYSSDTDCRLFVSKVDYP